MASILEELRWQRVAAHPGTWVHKENMALLVVYVDGFLMTAPLSHETKLWKALEARIHLVKSLLSSRNFWVLVTIWASVAT